MEWKGMLYTWVTNDAITRDFGIYLNVISKGLDYHMLPNILARVYTTHKHKVGTKLNSFVFNIDLESH